VTSKSLRIAGNELDSNIIQYARDKFNLLLGERTAEQIKIEIGSAFPEKEIKEAKMRGRDLISGLPKEVTITSAQLQEAISRTIRLFIENIKTTIETTPPELVADIFERGLVLTGGGALLRGLDKAIELEAKVPVHVIDDPLTAVVRGTGIILEDIESVKDLFVLSTHDNGISK